MARIPCAVEGDGVGIYGQYVWVDPTSQTVIAKFSSLPVPVDPVHSRKHMALFRAICGVTIGK